MNDEERKYLDLLRDILHGSERSDRTGVGTIGIFGTQLRFSLENNRVPMLTTKKMFVKGIIEELLFFLRGDVNTKLLEDKGVNIWKGNTTREFLDKRGLKDLPEGNMGKGYGYQWRKFGEQFPDCRNDECYIDTSGVDQLSQVIHTLKTNPTDRRIIMSAWNPKQLPEMALAPCHILCQFYANKDELSCQWYQRSVDTFLGLPFNILSYAILTKIIAQTVGMKPKELIFIGGDTHIYNNHCNQVKEQISREPYNFPELYIDKATNTVEDIEKLSFEDFRVENYKCHPSIKAPMAI
jgi:thymidylate synthase